MDLDGSTTTRRENDDCQKHDIPDGNNPYISQGRDLIGNNYERR